MWDRTPAVNNYYATFVARFNLLLFAHENTRYYFTHPGNIKLLFHQYIIFRSFILLFYLYLFFYLLARNSHNKRIFSGNLILLVLKFI